MVGLVMIYLGAFLLLFWGTAHLVPTRSVVKGFGGISLDNQRIIIMEWITEGIALIFIGLIVAAVTYVDPSSTVSRTVYWIAFVALNTLSVVSLFTGFKISFLPFKLCPVIFTTASLLILVGSLL